MEHPSHNEILTLAVCLTACFEGTMAALPGIPLGSGSQELSVWSEKLSSFRGTDAVLLNICL